MRACKSQCAALVIASCISAAPSVAVAQSDRNTHFIFSPYLWAPATKGTSGVGGQTTPVDASFSDIVHHLNLGFMAAFEIRRGQTFALIDGFYVALGADENPPGPILTNVSIKLHQFMMQPAIGYTAIQRSWGGIDALGGIRVWHVSADLTFEPSNGTPHTASGDQSWADGYIGSRLRYEPAGRWHLSLLGDVGAGGSNLTWEAVGGAGYDVSTCCTVKLGYRHLDVDYESSEFVNDLYMTGPILGFSWRF